MTIRRRIVNIFRASRTASEEPADPLRTLDDAHQQQLDLLDQARRSVADLAANRRRVELLAEQAAAEADRCNREAEQSVATGNDDDARAALRRGLAVGKRLAALTAQRRKLDDQVRGLEQTLRRLEDRLEDSRLDYQSLKADHGAAQAALGLQQALNASGQGAAGARTAAQQAERQTRQLQAQAAAREELAWSDPNSHLVQEAFEELDTRLVAEEELSRLKERKGLDPHG